MGKSIPSYQVCPWARHAALAPCDKAEWGPSWGWGVKLLLRRAPLWWWGWCWRPESWWTPPGLRSSAAGRGSAGISLQNSERSVRSMHQRLLVTDSGVFRDSPGWMSAHVSPSANRNTFNNKKNTRSGWNKLKVFSCFSESVFLSLCL